MAAGIAAAVPHNLSQVEAMYMSQQRTSVVGGMGLWQLEAGGGAELVAELDDLLYNDARECHWLHLQM